MTKDNVHHNLKKESIWWKYLKSVSNSQFDTPIQKTVALKCMERLLLMKN
jgi:hypothetical protein